MLDALGCCLIYSRYQDSVNSFLIVQVTFKTSRSGASCSKLYLLNIIFKTSTRLVNADYISKYTVIFLLIKCENPLRFSHFFRPFFQIKNNSAVAKDSHILSTKNNSVFVILPFEILTNR